MRTSADPLSLVLPSVLLGADASPLGFPLAIFLCAMRLRLSIDYEAESAVFSAPRESRGFIVIASVSTKQAANTLERLGHGYIKALVLNADAVSLLACS